MKYLWALMMCWVLPVQALDLQGVGIFTTLNKSWFITGLYSNDQQQAKRLDFRVVDEKITAYRFRQLWLEALSVVHSDATLQRHHQDIESFFNVVYGPLQLNDHLIVEQQPDATIIQLNYREHARLSAEFLPLLVETLTARIAPVPELRAGLLGELPPAEQRNIMREFDRSAPELRRIAETSRWLRKRQQVTAQYSGSVSQL